MVLPVPDRPKNSATSPSLADIGAAVHRHHALGGSSQFMMVKIDFFTSPAYSLPAMTIIFCSNDRAMVVLERTPSISGSVWNSGAWRMT